MLRSFLPRSLVLLALALSGSALAQSPITLKVHHFLPPGSTTHAKMLVPWCERIEKASAGRMKCQLYPSMQLGGTAPQLFDQARDGIADVVWTLPGYTAGRFPRMEVFELPFMIGDAEAASKAAWEFYEKHARDEFREVGLKLRAPTRQTNRLLAALGATPVSMPVTGLADAMSKGVIDGAVIPWEVVPAVKVQEIARFHTETDPNMPAMYTAVFLLAMNRKTYDGLPPDLRAVIDRNSGLGLSGQAGRLWDQQKAPARKLALDRGNTVYVVPAAELAHWQAAAQPVLADWVRDMGKRGIDGDGLLADARALIVRHSRAAAPPPMPAAAPSK